MKPVMKGKMLIDLIMTAGLLFQMAYMLVGNTIHEWMGAGMFLLFLIHHGLNWRWYRNLLRGRYTPVRVLQTMVNFLVLLCMLGLMVSGILLSRDVFVFLDVQGHSGTARILHMLSSYWGFLLMSVHIGLHWAMVLGMMRNAAGKKAPGKEKAKEISPARKWGLRAIGAAVGIYGLYGFLKHDIASYLFLRSLFVFFDGSQPLWLFLTEYLAIMCLWAQIAYYLARGLQKLKSRGERAGAGKK